MEHELRKVGTGLARTLVRASLAAILSGKSFPDVFAGQRKWLRRVHQLFHLAVMKPNAGADAKIGGVNVYDVTRLKYL